MKKYIIGFAVVLLLAAGWLMWIDVGGNKQSPKEVKEQAGNNIPASIESERPKWKDVVEAVTKEQTVPIDFWGRIVDQNNEPVVGVRLEIRVYYFDRRVLDQRFHRLEMQSDEKGEFRISGMKGSGLTIEFMKKENYKLSENSRLSYGYSSAPQYRYHPDPNNPVVFRMWKKQGGEKLVEGKKFYGIKPDGRIYTLDLLQQKKTEGEVSGDIRISIKRPAVIANSYDKFDWEFTIESVGGGVIETSDDFLYLAPEVGYQTKLEYKLSASAVDWKSRMRKEFYVKSRNGQVYASLYVQVIPDYDEDAVFDVKYYANPSGSRNLER